MSDKITIEEYCQDICNAPIKAEDFREWFKLYNFQPIEIKVEKKLEHSDKETRFARIKLIEVKQELEINKFILASIKSDLAVSNRKLTRSKALNKKIETELENKNTKLKTELKQTKLQLRKVLKGLNRSKKKFQEPSFCAHTFVDDKKERLLIENTIKQFKHCFDFTSNKSAFLELGIQIKVSDEGSVRLNRLMKSFCYKTAYEAIKYFKQNKVNAIAIKQKPTVEDKSSFVAFSIDPSQNSVGLIIPTEIK